MNDMPFQIIVVDDDPDDIQLTEIQLSKINMELEVKPVGSREAFQEYLNNEPLPDLVICDYQLPEYNGEKALRFVRDLHDYVPFILVTGYLDEEQAVELMRKGASDIITKQKLDRLGPAVQRELINFRERREAQREIEIARNRFQSLVEQGGDVVVVLGEEGYPEYVSPSVVTIFGYSVEEAMSVRVNEVTHPDDLHHVEKALEQAKKSSGQNIPVPPVRMKHKNGTWRWCKTSLTDMRHQSSVSGIVDNIRDIHEQVLNARTNQLMLNNTEDSFIYINRDLIIESYNDRFAKNYKDIFGIEVKRGDSILEYAQPGRREIVKDIYDRVLVGETVERDHSFETNDGTNRYFHVKYKPARDEKENIIGSFISLIEVTEEKKAKLDLKKNETRYRTLVENGSDILFILNPEGEIKYVSPSIKNVLSYTAEEAMLTNMMENAHPDDVEIIMDEIKKCLDQPGVPLKVPPARLKDKEGHWHWFEGTITNMLHDPAIKGIVDNFHEITERIEAEQKTAEAKNQYQSLIQTVDGIVWEADAETLVFNYVSPQAEKILGYSPDEWIGKKEFWQKRIHPDDRERAVSFCSRQTDKGVNHVFEYRMKKADGDYIWLRDVITVVSDLGETEALRGLMIDIDQEKDLELKLEQAYQLAKIGNWELDLVYEKLYWSNYIKELHEVDDDYEPNLDTAIDFYKEGWSRDTISGAVEHSIKTGEPFDHEVQIETAKGNERWVRAVGRPEFVDETCVRVYGSTQDITERKKAQIEQRKAEEKHRNVVEHSTNMFYQHDTNGVLTYVSPQSKQFLGYPPEEAKRQWTEFVTDHPNNKNGEKITQRAIETGKVQEPYDLQLKTTDNRIIWVEVNEAPLVKDGNVEGIVGSLTDITDRKQFEEQLKESLERYEYVTQATSDAIWEFVPGTGKLFWGQGFKTLFGYDKIGYDKGIEKWISQIHPEDIGKIKSGVQELLEGSETNWNEEYRFKKTDGTYAYIQDNAIVIRDEAGNTERVVGAMKDITERKEKERELKLMESVVTNTTDAILITKAEHVDAPEGPEIVYVNKAFEKMTGYSADEIIGKTPRVLQGPNTDYNALKELGEKIRRWEHAEVETINYKKNGEEFWINFSVTPLANDTGWYTHWISVERDVTDRKNRELKQGLISEIGRIFNSTESLLESLEKVLSEIQKLGDFQLAEIWLVNHNKDSIDLAASLKDQTEQFYELVNGIESFKKGEGLPGVTWQNRDIQFWKNLDTREDFIRNKSAKKAGIKTAYGLPIIYNQEVKGVLLLGVNDTPDKPHYFAPILKEIAERLGDEIHRKRLEEELSRIFASAPDGIIVAGFDGYFKKVNPAMSEILEYSVEELLKTPFIEFIHPEDREETLRMYEEVNSGAEKFYFENRYITKSGKVVWLSWTFKVFLEEEVAYSVAKNITDQKRLEKLLDQSNELSKIGSWEVDVRDEKIYWSEITREIHEVDEVFEPSLEEGINFYKQGESREIITEAVQKAIENGEGWDVELQIVTASGNEKWVRVIGEPEMIDGKCVRIYGSFQEVHQRKTAELALQKSLIEKNEILESIGDAFFAVDENWIVTYWNHMAENVIGMPREKIVGKNLWDVYEDAIPLDFYTKYHKAVKEQVTVHFEEFYPALEKWFDLSAYPSESGLSVYFKDITERKKAQKQLIDRTRQLDAIAMFNSLLIKQDSWEDALEKSFPAFGELVNCDRVYYFKNVSGSDGKQTVSMIQEWVKEGISSQIDNPQHHNVPHDEIWDFVEPLMNGKSFNYAVKDIKNKEFRELLISQDIKSLLALPVFTGSEFQGFIGFDDCTTERTWREEEISFLKTITINLASAIESEDAEKAIQKAYKEKNEILESIGDGFFTVDKEFIVNYWNNQAEEMLYTPKEKIVGQFLWDVFDKKQAKKSYQQYSRALKERTSVKFEDYYDPIDRWFDVNVYPSENGISVFFKDITDRKESQQKLQELNQSLEQQAKELARSNAELEQFAFVASHDLQEPLRMITGFLAQLEKKYDHLLDEKGIKYIHFATDGAKRMREIILDLLEFSRIGRVDTEREKIDLNQLINEVTSLNKKLITESGAEIHADGLPVILASRGPIRQLFQNLINNGLKYQEADNKPVIHINWNEDESYWYFSVRDNGIGFNEEYKDKIFNIFQRLHGSSEYSGSGMGLAICKKIVEEHGGDILAESEEGVGSTFKFAIAKQSLK